VGWRELQRRAGGEVFVEEELRRGSAEELAIDFIAGERLSGAMKRQFVRVRGAGCRFRALSGRPPDGEPQCRPSARF
jgi:hypothetical protein